MSWHPYPFVRLIFPLIIGICAAEWTNFKTCIPLIAAVLLFVLMIIISIKTTKFETRTYFGIATFGFLFALGWQLTIFHHEKNRPDHFSNYLAEHQSHFLIATVDEPIIRTARKLRTRVKVQAIGHAADSLQNCSGNLLIYLDTTIENTQILYGDVLLLEEKIQPVPPPANPDGFDYQHYLHVQNIHYQAFTVKNSLHKVASDRGNWVWKTAYLTRDKFLAILQKHFPTPDEYAVASALLVGYKNDLSDEIKNAYIQTGSMHALAVSGMHVGGLYLALGVFFRHILPKKSARLWLEVVVSILVIWGFTFITGASASVLRAAVMFTVLVIGRALRRDSDMYNTLSASAFLLLVFNPMLLFDVGFQLSYLAVLGIIFFGQKFLKMYTPPRGFGWAWETLAIGFAAQIATLPLSLFYFHQMPTYFWLSGLLVVPLGMIVLWGGMLLFLVDGLLEPLANLIGKILFCLVWTMNKGIFIIQQLPFNLLENISITAIAAILLYGLIISTTAFLQLRQPRWAIAGLGCVAILTANHAFEQFCEQKTKKITIFSISGKSMIDFQSGVNLTTFTDSISEKDLGFATNRAKKLETTLLYFVADTTFQTANLFYEPPFVQFFDKKMLLIDAQHPLLDWHDSPPVLIDLVLFRQNPFVKIVEVQRQFSAKKFIFDGSNSYSNIKKWTIECTNLGLEYQDLRKSGAFQMSW